MSRAIAITAGVTLAALLAGTYALTLRQGAECARTVVAGGDIGGPFTLVSETGETVTSEQVITQPSLIYFGYTFCPDVCPIDNARNAAAVDILAEDGHAVTPIFITVDPARDTVEVVRDYTENFHDRMVGLTGSEVQVEAAAKAYRVFYRKADDDPEFYLVDHSVFTYLVTPTDGFITFFRRDDSPEAVAEATACVL